MNKEKLNLKIPVLSTIPLIDNVVVHNTIDSEHKMKVILTLTDQLELMISNPVYPKLTAPITNGTGLKNLENRFLLLTGRHIRIDADEKTYRVFLPLKPDPDENPNR